MPSISVIVPIYCVEKYLNQCIESIINQTYKNIEIILVDDGSIDKCAEICDMWSRRDARIKVIHKENGGLVSARKAGLYVATGEYIAYVDGDDWIEPNMYEVMVECAIKNSADITICGFIEEGVSSSKHIDNLISAGLYKDNEKDEMLSKSLYSGKYFEFGIFPVVWNKLFKKEILLDNQIKVNDEIRMGEDVACTFPTLIDAKSICIMGNTYFYHYRKIGNSMTAKYDKNYFERIFYLYKYLFEVFDNKNNEILKEQLKYYFSFLYFTGIQQEFSKQNKNSFIKKCRKIKNLNRNNNIKEKLSYIDSSKLNFKYKGLKFFSKYNLVIFEAIYIYITKVIDRGVKKFYA